MKLVKELPIPEISLTQAVSFAILYTLEVCKEPEFVRWAEDWLNDSDRSASSAFIVCATLCKSAPHNEESNKNKLFGIWLASRAAYAAYCMARATYHEGMVLQARDIVAELIDAAIITKINLNRQHHEN